MILKFEIRHCALALLYTVLVQVVTQANSNEEQSNLSLKFLKNYTSEVLGPACDEAGTIYFLEHNNNTQFMSKYTISSSSFSRLLEKPIGSFKDVIFSYGIHAGNFWLIASNSVFKFDISTNELVNLGGLLEEVYVKSTFAIQEPSIYFVSPATYILDTGHSHIVRYSLTSRGTTSVATFKRESDRHVFLTSYKSKKIYIIILEAGYMYEFDTSNAQPEFKYLKEVYLKGTPVSFPRSILPVANFIVSFTATKVFYVDLKRRVTVFENLNTPFPESLDYQLKPIYAKSTQTIYVFVEGQALKAITSVEACRSFSKEIASKTLHATKWSSVSLKCDVPTSPKSIIEWFSGREPMAEIETIDSSAELVLKHSSLNLTSTYKCASESICGVRKQLIHLQVTARTPSAKPTSVLNVKPGSNALLDCYPEKNNFNSKTTVWLKNTIFWNTSLDPRVHQTKTGIAIHRANEADGGNYTCLLDTTFNMSHGVTNKSENVEFELNLSDAPKIIYVNTTTQNADGGTANNSPVIYILFALILVPIVLIGSYWFNKVRNQNPLGLTAQEIREFKQGRHTLDLNAQNTEQLADTRPYDDNYELPAYSFQIQRESSLGEGQFGVVYKGVLKLDDKVEDAAFKTTKNVEDAKQHLKSLLSEIKILIYIGRHPSIIRMFGAYTRQLRSGVLFLALEFCSNVSLERLLRSSKHESEIENPDVNRKCITNAMQLDWSLQITNGMDYLASKKVIHSDLATRNVLVAQDLSTRITDFGLSRRLQNYESYVKTGTEPLPWRWMALESLEHRSFSTESDVWSFGVTLWEIYSMGKVPFHNQTWSTVFVEQLKAGEHLPLPTHGSEEIFCIMKRCWDLDSMQRPKFKDLSNFLQEIVYRNQSIIYE